MSFDLRYLFIIFLCSHFTLACSGNSTKTATPTQAKNTILFIGDGMGAEHRKAARWVKAGSKGKLHMDDMPASGFLNTGSAKNPITDSAASATAMSCGVKTNNGVIGLDSNLSFVPTILEQAKSRNKRVGLVTTTHITHATPAAFAAHVASRKYMTEIAEQMLISGVNVLMGGGEDVFIPETENGCFPGAGKRADQRNLISEAIANGYVHVCDSTELNTVDIDTTSHLIGLFADEGMNRPFSPSLAEMTQKAIELLSKGSQGFFLMVEAGQIDWASHDNDAYNTIHDTIGLDEAIGVAQQFASIDNNTLIIVTADHETGGLRVSYNKSNLPTEDGPFASADGKLFYVNWAGTHHTSVEVPVTAQGFMSEKLNGQNENTYIHELIYSTFDTFE